MIYLTDPATIDADRRKVIELMKDLEGVAEAIEPARYGELGFSTPDKNPQAPDLVLVGKDGYAFSNIATGEDAVIEPILGRHNVGYHGYVSSDPRMNAMFVASGRGVRAGAKAGMVDNIDVAPTIAGLLGVELPAAQGVPMAEVLAAPR